MMYMFAEDGTADVCVYEAAAGNGEGAMFSPAQEGRRRVPRSGWVTAGGDAALFPVCFAPHVADCVTSSFSNTPYSTLVSHLKVSWSVTQCDLA